MIISFDLHRVLIAVAESRNFREAAEKLHLSQPAVSVKLKELEAHQPLPLFNLEGKRKVLTHYGRSLYEIAKRGTASLERNIEELHRHYSSAQQLTLRIGGRSEVLEYIAPRLEFDGRLEFQNCSSREASERLLQHQIDVAISYVVPDSGEIQAKKLFSSTASFFVHEKFLKSRMLSRELIRDKEFLRSTPCVSYSREGHIVGEWVRHVGLAYEDLNVRYVAEDWGTLLKLVEQGAGFALMPMYVESSSPAVHRLELPKDVIEHLDFYAIFETNLKRIEAFKKVLSFSGLRQ